MRTLRERLSAIIDPLPAGSAVTLPVDAVRAWLTDEGEAPVPAPLAVEPIAETWRTRLWTCPPETRLGVREVAEALDRSPDWVYRAVNRRLADEKGRDPLPCSRMDGVLVFSAGAVRRWVQVSESVVVPERASLRRSA